MNFGDIKKKFNETCDKIDESLSAVPYADMISEKVKVRKVYIAFAVALVFLLTLVVSLGVNIIGNLIVFIYPVYASFKAIQSNNKDDDTQWLTYWVIYALLSVLESVDLVIKHFPYYRLVKFVFLVLCFLPQTQVARMIYDKILYPYIVMDKKNE